METLPSLYRSLCFRQCLAIVPNRPSSVKERIKKFPPNACRGERCGVWGRTAPSRLVQAMVGKDSYGSRDFQSVRSNTASFRATATTARFLALAVPSWARRSPCSRSALSGPEGPQNTTRRPPADVADSGLRIWKSVIPCQSLRFGPASGIIPGRLQCRAFARSAQDSRL